MVHNFVDYDSLVDFGNLVDFVELVALVICLRLNWNKAKRYLHGNYYLIFFEFLISKNIWTAIICKNIWIATRNETKLQN